MIYSALSRFQFSNAGAGSPRFEGNISTGGGLPQITGRMEQQASGNTAFRLRMAEYAAGDARIAIPELYVAQANNGALGFAGRVAASGAFPGGRATNLVLPVSGNWSGVRGLTFAGGSAHPGPGMPMVVMSGWIAGDALAGQLDCASEPVVAAA